MHRAALLLAAGAVALPTAAEQARLTALPQEIAAKKQAAEDRRQQARAEFEPWLAERGKTPMEEPAQAALAFHFPLNEAARVFHGTSGGQPAQWTERTEPFEGMTGPAPIASGQAVSGRAPAIARDGKASYGLMMRSEAKASGAILSRMDAARAFRGWDLFLSAGRPAVHIVDQWPDKALKVTAKAALTDGAWHHLMVVFDGTKAGAEAENAGQREPDQPVADGSEKERHAGIVESAQRTGDEVRRQAEGRRRRAPRVRQGRMPGTP